MCEFSIDDLANILPSNLGDNQSKLAQKLFQFTKGGRASVDSTLQVDERHYVKPIKSGHAAKIDYERKIDYNGFYLPKRFDPKVIQGTILTSVSFHVRYEDGWSQELQSSPVLILSNSCDISPENDRTGAVNKTEDLRVALLPLVELRDYEQVLIDLISDENELRSIMEKTTQQLYSRIFYIPIHYENTRSQGYVGFMDHIFSVPLKLLHTHVSPNVEKAVIDTFDNFGLYLFYFKFFFHFGRFPNNR